MKESTIIPREPKIPYNHESEAVLNYRDYDLSFAGGNGFMSANDGAMNAGISPGMKRASPVREVLGEPSAKRMLHRKEEEEGTERSRHVTAERHFDTFQNTQAGSPGLRRSLLEALASAKTMSGNIPLASAEGRTSDSVSLPPCPHALRKCSCYLKSASEKPPSVCAIPSEKQGMMKDTMRQSNQLFDELCQHKGDGADEVNGSAEANDSTIDDVKVQLAKQGCVVSFRCPCGRMFQLLLSDKDLFYKLNVE